MPNKNSDLTSTSRHSILNWQGRSGAHYALIEESLDSFVMNETDLYLVTDGHHVLWIGSASELISDANSRASFRKALGAATGALRLEAPLDRNAAIWDLEGGLISGTIAARAA